MRERFNDRPELGMKPIEETPILVNSRDAMYSLVRALLAVYGNEQYRERILDLIEERVSGNKKETGRMGLTYWQIFVLAEFRMGLNLSYDRLHSMAFSDSMLRQLLGIESVGFQERIVFSRKRILQNVQLITDDELQKINTIIVEFAHNTIFTVKKKEGLSLKTDSFPVQAVVHFPSDYSLLNDSARKAGDVIKKILAEGNVAGWRKLSNWVKTLKKFQRNYTQAKASGGKNKDQRVQKAADALLKKARAFSKKLKVFIHNLHGNSVLEIASIKLLEKYLGLMDKHIDLFHRRVKLGEKIPHQEKLFSIFEPFVEWISKGKREVEIGKNVSITTDQHGLIIDYYIMENESDSQIVISTKDRVLARHKVYSWSFDKGYWKKTNFEELAESVPLVVMPKKGKPNKEEKARESNPKFKKLRNKHSAIESNINELEHSGLHRCRDKKYKGFKRYVGMGVIAYNLKRIGKQLLKQDKAALLKAA